MLRRSFLRTAMAALMAQWIRLPEPELVIDWGLESADYSLGFMVTRELIEDDVYRKQLEQTSRRLTELPNLDAYLYEKL